MHRHACKLAENTFIGAHTSLRSLRGLYLSRGSDSLITQPEPLQMMRQKYEHRRWQCQTNCFNDLLLRLQEHAALPHLENVHMPAQSVMRPVLH